MSSIAPDHDWAPALEAATKELMADNWTLTDEPIDWDDDAWEEWGYRNVAVGIAQGFYETDIELSKDGIRIWNRLFWEPNCPSLCPEPIIVKWEELLAEWVSADEASSVADDAFISPVDYLSAINYRREMSARLRAAAAAIDETTAIIEQLAESAKARD